MVGPLHTIQRDWLVLMLRKIKGSRLLSAECILVSISEIDGTLFIIILFLT